MITLKGYIKGLMKRRVLAKRKNTRKKMLSKRSLEQFGELEKRIGYIFKDKARLKLALTHPSAMNTAHSRINSNQRLEFLGDAVLQTIISDFVFKSLEDKTEGDLTRARIALTHGKFLAKLADRLGIPESLILPKKLSHLREVASAKEDSIEALIGAIYLDCGFENTKKIVLGWYESASLDVEEMVDSQNPKGQLQELAAKKKMTVEYKLLSQIGPDHDKKFEMAVLVNGEVYGSAIASSKKQAETEAAAIALKKLV